MLDPVRVPRRLGPLGAVLGLGLLLGGCGSVTVHHITTTITRSATSAGAGAGTGSTTSAASSTGSTSTQSGAVRSRSGAPLAGDSPAAIVRAAAGALRRSGGYAMNADLHQGGGTLGLALTTSGGRSFDATLMAGGGVSEIINLPPETYLRGDRAFWLEGGHDSSTARRRAGELAGHWLRVPASGRRRVLGSLGSLGPVTLARCLTEDHGTLSIAGHTTIAGTRAVLVRDAGNAPGATPGTLAVAASGTPYPLRYTATGATRRGGRVDVCNDGKGGSATGTIELSQFGQVAQIEPPQAAQSGGGGSLA